MPLSSCNNALTLYVPASTHLVTSTLFNVYVYETLTPWGNVPSILII